MKTMIRPSFRALFNLRPALLLPSADRLLIPLERTSYRTLAAPTQLPQHPPHLPRMLSAMTAASVLELVSDNQLWFLGHLCRGEAQHVSGYRIHPEGDELPQSRFHL